MLICYWIFDPWEHDDVLECEDEDVSEALIDDGSGASVNESSGFSVSAFPKLLFWVYSTSFWRF